MTESHHLSHQYLVVASIIAKRQPALELRDAARKEWRPPDAAFELQIGEAILHARGESIGQRLLVCRQDMHGETRTLSEGAQRRRRAIEAPEHQRRFERDRIEAVGSYTDIAAI